MIFGSGLPACPRLPHPPLLLLSVLPLLATRSSPTVAAVDLTLEKSRVGRPKRTGRRLHPRVLHLASPTLLLLPTIAPPTAFYPFCPSCPPCKPLPFLSHRHQTIHSTSEFSSSRIPHRLVLVTTSVILFLILPLAFSLLCFSLRQPWSDFFLQALRESRAQTPR